jgi:hypothetical protein
MNSYLLLTSKIYEVLRDRLLFHIDFQLYNFGIAKHIEKNYDCDLFAIVDLDEKPQKFFYEQKLVDFEKVWYYRNEVIKNYKLPDNDYLNSFEEKYHINLWSIAYTERAFNQYNNYYRFNRNEILSILEQECKFFEKVLEDCKPNFLLLNMTERHHTHLLCELAKAKGIKVLMLVNTRFGHRMIISEDMDIMDSTVDYNPNSSDKVRTADELFEYFTQNQFYTSLTNVEDKMYTYRKNLFGAAAQFFLFSGSREYRKHYTNHGKTRTKALLVESLILMKKAYRQFFINRCFTRKIDKARSFVYFPLHADPERALLQSAPYYTDQIEVVKNVAKSLPINYELLVKDHPLMKLSGWRSLSNYKRILELPNVKLVNPSLSRDELMKNCSLVITIGGTSAVEAAFYGKPSLIFADVWGYTVLSSIQKVRTIEELPHLIRKMLKKKVEPKELNEYVNLVNRNSFELDPNVLISEVLHRFYYNGLFSNVPISLFKMESFINDFSSSFEKLSQEYIKKIRQHNQLSSVDRVSGI